MVIAVQPHTRAPGQKALFLTSVNSFIEAASVLVRRNHPMESLGYSPICSSTQGTLLSFHLQPLTNVHAMRHGQVR